jgi:hypothetical protein
MIFRLINLLHSFEMNDLWYLDLLSDTTTLILAILVDFNTKEFKRLSVDDSDPNLVNIVDALLWVFIEEHPIDLFELNDITVLELVLIVIEHVNYNLSFFTKINALDHDFLGFFTIIVKNCEWFTKVIEATAK